MAKSLSLYEELRKYKKRFPATVAWRLKSHAKVAELHLNPGEEIKYVFCGQKGDSNIDFISTTIGILTNKRLLFARKRLFFGYFFTSITPDLFNDLKIKMGLIWGGAHIDTLKELVIISNLQREALPELETAITTQMIKEKRKYAKKPEKIKEKH